MLNKKNMKDAINKSKTNNSEIVNRNEISADPYSSGHKQTWQIVIFVIITSIIIGVGVYYWQDINQRTIPPPSLNQLPATVAPPRQKLSSEIKLLLLNRAKSEVVSTTLNTNKKSFFYKISDQGIQEAKYKKDQLVYIKSDNSTDSLININTKTGTKQEIDSKYNGYSCDDHNKAGYAACVDNQHLNQISELSPNAYYVTYWISGWEWCSDRIVNLEDKSEISIHGWCGKTKWSPDGKRITVYSQNGIASGNSLGLTQKDNINKVIDIDFSQVQGDINKIKLSTYQGKKYLDTGIVGADFINSDEIVFLGTEYDSSGQHYKIFIYDDSKNYLRYVKTIEKSGNEYFQELRYIPKINSVLINSKSRFILVNLAAGEQKEIAADILKELADYYETEIEDVLSDGKTVVLSLNDKRDIVNTLPDGTKLYTSQRKALKTFSLDLETNQYQILSENKDVIYIGFIE